MALTDHSELSVLFEKYPEIAINKAIAASTAAIGACGSPGELVILMSDGNILKINTLNDGVPVGAVAEFLKMSGLNQIVYMGLGNNLYIRAGDSRWLNGKLNKHIKNMLKEGVHCYDTAVLYKNWMRFYLEKINSGNIN